MLKQNLTIEQNYIKTTDMEDEFQNIESIILKMLKLLDENTKLMKIAKNEIRNTGGENLE